MMGDAVSSVGGIADNVLGTNMFGDNAYDKARDAQVGSASDANRVLREQFEYQKEQNKPFQEAGVSALGLLGKQDLGMGDFTGDPGYQFRLAEGQKAINNAMSARGMSNSGAALKDLTRFGQDLATSEYAKAYDRNIGRLSSLTGLGQNAISNLTGAAQNYGGQVSSNVLGVGNAQAAAQLGKAQAQANAVKQGISAAAMFSDENLKTDVRLVTKQDLNELRTKIRPVLFKYKNEVHGKGEWLGVMAQELEKTKIGKNLVDKDSNGNLTIDANKAVSLILATLCEGTNGN